MNWSKIKSILICILLVTNILLFLNLEASTPSETEREIEDIRKLYASKGVVLDYSEIDIPAKVNGRVAELMVISAEQEDNIYHYFSSKDGEYNFSVKDNMIQCLWSEIPEHASFSAENPENPENPNGYMEKSKVFFDQMSIDFQPGYLKFYSISDILVVKVYQEVKNNIPEIESSVYLYFYEGEIVGLRLEKCLKLSSELGGSYAIISPADALYKALTVIPSGDVLTGMRIVYKLNDDSLLAANLVRGEMFPYYELNFKDAPPLYIRATK